MGNTNGIGVSLVTRLALVIGLSTLAAAAPTARAEDLPPSWDTGSGLYEPAAPTVKATKKKRRGGRSWYQPRVLVGVGLNFPELVPVETYLLFGKYFGLRFFYTPPLPFNIRVEMPADVISTKKGVGVANPEFTVRMKAIYGAHYGAEALAFPFGGSFFVALGASHRAMKLSGEARSPVLVCSLIEASKEPPCPDPAARIQTATELEVTADVESTALLTRAAVGWIWDVGSFGYLMLNAGATKPNHIRQKAKVETALDAPGADDDLVGALAQVKAERESDLEDKALKEMRPVQEKVLPILGIAAGIRF